MGVGVVGTDGLLQEFNGFLLALVVVALLVVEPSQLLQDLGMVGIAIENASVSSLRSLKLDEDVST